MLNQPRNVIEDDIIKSFSILILMIKVIYYQSIPAELKRLGLTQEKAATLLGCTRSGLTHRIKADKQQFHWAIYGLAGLANYLEKKIKDV